MKTFEEWLSESQDNTPGSIERLLASTPGLTFADIRNKTGLGADELRDLIRQSGGRIVDDWDGFNHRYYRHGSLSNPYGAGTDQIGKSPPRKLYPGEPVPPHV